MAWSVQGSTSLNVISRPSPASIHEDHRSVRSRHSCHARCPTTFPKRLPSAYQTSQTRSSPPLQPTALRRGPSLRGRAVVLYEVHLAARYCSGPQAKGVVYRSTRSYSHAQLRSAIEMVSPFNSRSAWQKSVCMLEPKRELQGTNLQKSPRDKREVFLTAPIETALSGRCQVKTTRPEHLDREFILPAATSRGGEPMLIFPGGILRPEEADVVSCNLIVCACSRCFSCSWESIIGRFGTLHS
jgi:hypothetical protein